MKNKNSEIEDALFQIRNLEEALNRNAQGILASTMKEEISSLVKESLKEAEEDEEEIDTEVDSTEDDDSDEDAFDNSEMDLMGDEYDDESDEEETDSLPVANVDLTVGDGEDEEEEVIDATPDGLNLSNDEIITVFRSLDPSDSIVVKKENNKIHLKDDEKDVEYLIQLGESEEDEFEMKETGRRHSRMRDEFSYDEMEEMYGRHARKPKFKMEKELDFDFDEFEPGFDLKGDFDLGVEETETIYEV